VKLQSEPSRPDSRIPTEVKNQNHTKSANLSFNSFLALNKTDDKSALIPTTLLESSTEEKVKNSQKTIQTNNKNLY